MDGLIAEIGSLRKRVEQVEFQNQLMKWIGITCLFLVAFLITATISVLSTGASLQALVGGGIHRAKGYVLEDYKGRARGEFCLVSGEPMLRLLDEKHRAKASIFLMDGRPVVSLQGPVKIGAYLTIQKDGRPVLSLHDERGKSRAALFLNKDGNPTLTFFSRRGESQAAFAASGAGSTGICLWNESGKRIWSAP